MHHLLLLLPFPLFCHFPSLTTSHPLHLSASSTSSLAPCFSRTLSRLHQAFPLSFTLSSSPSFADSLAHTPPSLLHHIPFSHHPLSISCIPLLSCTFPSLSHPLPSHSLATSLTPSPLLHFPLPLTLSHSLLSLILLQSPVPFSSLALTLTLACSALSHSLAISRPILLACTSPLSLSRILCPLILLQPPCPLRFSSLALSPHSRILCSLSFSWNIHCPHFLSCTFPFLSLSRILCSLILLQPRLSPSHLLHFTLSLTLSHTLLSHSLATSPVPISSLALSPLSHSLTFSALILLQPPLPPLLSCSFPFLSHSLSLALSQSYLLLTSTLPFFPCNCVLPFTLTLFLCRTINLSHYASTASLSLAPSPLSHFYAFPISIFCSHHLSHHLSLPLSSHLSTFPTISLPLAPLLSHFSHTISLSKALPLSHIFLSCTLSPSHSDPLCLLHTFSPSYSTLSCTISISITPSSSPLVWPPLTSLAPCHLPQSLASFLSLSPLWYSLLSLSCNLPCPPLISCTFPSPSHSLLSIFLMQPSLPPLSSTRTLTLYLTPSLLHLHQLSCSLAPLYLQLLSRTHTLFRSCNLFRAHNLLHSHPLPLLRTPIPSLSHSPSLLHSHFPPSPITSILHSLSCYQHLPFLLPTSPFFAHTPFSLANAPVTLLHHLPLASAYSLPHALTLQHTLSNTPSLDHSLSTTPSTTFSLPHTHSIYTLSHYFSLQHTLHHTPCSSFPLFLCLSHTRTPPSVSHISLSHHLSPTLSCHPALSLPPLCQTVSPQHIHSLPQPYLFPLFSPTHTHKHAHTRTHTHTHILILSSTNSLWPTHFLSHTHTHTHTLLPLISLPQSLLHTL